FGGQPGGWSERERGLGFLSQTAADGRFRQPGTVRFATAVFTVLVRADECCGTGAVNRLRQRGRALVGARGRTAQRDGCPAGARRGAAATGAATPHGEHAARGARQFARLVLCLVGDAVVVVALLAKRNPAAPQSQS